MSTQAVLRVGVVGCGYQGLALAKAVLLSESLRLVAGADPDEAAIRTVAALAPDVQRFENVDALLAGADVDAVLIATPHDVLATAALAVIRAGRHVLVEKPMALDAAQASAVEFAAASAGVVCMAGYSFRYSMARGMHEVVAAGAVGDLTALSGAIWAPRMDDGWVAAQERGGGPLLYLGCHMVDLVLWLVGEEPERVSASVSHRAETGVDDTSAIRMEFAGGTPAQLLVSQSAADFGYELHVLGTSGSISLRGHDFLDYEVRVHSTAVDAYRQPTVLPNPQGDPVTTMFVPELSEFADAITQNRAPAITASDGRRVLRVLDSVTESARTGQAATLGAPMLAAY